ncbi:hypothetical protein EJ06DRAFT_554229 [Trichodelitschia bisporula]|uniref:Uncharacterized protein n=1 Tax=Trichodelitschia bisporula TaxID=703511 RepID=A0A6G1I767_9PEZI|nr:hypothetical protein EJ06DRAFT_554229 [Trichodelitschia bisporula]
MARKKRAKGGKKKSGVSDANESAPDHSSNSQNGGRDTGASHDASSSNNNHHNAGITNPTVPTLSWELVKAYCIAAFPPEHGDSEGMARGIYTGVHMYLACYPDAAGHVEELESEMRSIVNSGWKMGSAGNAKTKSLAQVLFAKLMGIMGIQVKDATTGENLVEDGRIADPKDLAALWQAVANEAASGVDTGHEVRAATPENPLSPAENASNDDQASPTTDDQHRADIIAQHRADIIAQNRAPIILQHRLATNLGANAPTSHQRHVVDGEVVHVPIKDRRIRLDFLNDCELPRHWDRPGSGTIYGQHTTYYVVDPGTGLPVLPNSRMPVDRVARRASIQEESGFGGVERPIADGEERADVEVHGEELARPGVEFSDVEESTASLGATLDNTLDNILARAAEFAAIVTQLHTARSSESDGEESASVAHHSAPGGGVTDETTENVIPFDDTWAPIIESVETQGRPSSSSERAVEESASAAHPSAPGVGVADEETTENAMTFDDEWAYIVESVETQDPPVGSFERVEAPSVSVAYTPMPGGWVSDGDTTESEDWEAMGPTRTGTW